MGKFDSIKKDYFPAENYFKRNHIESNSGSLILISNIFHFSKCYFNTTEVLIFHTHNGCNVLSLFRSQQHKNRAAFKHKIYWLFWRGVDCCKLQAKSKQIEYKYFRHFFKKCNKNGRMIGKLLVRLIYNHLPTKIKNKTKQK